MCVHVIALRLGHSPAPRLADSGGSVPFTVVFQDRGGAPAMSKALLMSVLVAAIAIPLRAARRTNAVRGAKSTAIQTVAFVLLWTAALHVLYPLLKN